MPVDIRGTVNCNLGTLISASLSDSYLPNAGYIKTTGTAIIAGTINELFSPSDDVEFIVSPPGSKPPYRIPRYVKVTSARYNPLERTTRVELGCNFAIKETFSQSIVWTPKDDPENANATTEDLQVITTPIHAKSVFAFCMEKLNWLGIDANRFRQTFSRPEFDFSGGYVQVISDLLLSSGLVGFGLSSNIVSATPPDGLSTFVLNETNLIDFKPYAGALIPSSVSVDYDTIRLKQPETEDQAKTNWEYEEVIGAPTTIRISYKNDDETWESTFAYIPNQRIWREYDSWDRLVRSVTINRSIGAAVAASYCQALVQDDFNTGSTVIGARGIAYGNSKFDTTTVTTIKYTKDAPAGVSASAPNVPEQGYEEVLSETSETYKASAEILCSVAPGFFDEDDNLITIGNGVSYEILSSVAPPSPILGTLTERTIVTYDQQKRNVTTITETVTDDDGNESYRFARLGYFPVTKTITQSVKCYGLTSRGQQDIATRVEQGETLEDIAGDVLALADDGTEVRIVSGREAVLQARPSAADRILAKNADTSGNVSDNGYSTEQQSETIFLSGSESINALRLRIPYVSDDLFFRSGVAPNVTYTSERPEVLPEEAAAAFGRVQAKLASGGQLGVSVQCAGNALGSRPVNKIAVIIGDSSAYYYLNGTTYTISNEGVVAGADLIAIGNGGGLTAWLPSPQGVESLPDLPTITSTAPTALLGTIATVGSTPQTALNAAYPGADAGDGVRAEDTYSYWVYNGTTWVDVGLTPGDVVTNPVIVPIYEEIVLLRGTVRSKLHVTRIPYALALFTEAPALTIRCNPLIERYQLANVPSVTISIEAFVPVVASSTAVRPATGALTIAAPVPTVGYPVGNYVSVPASTITVAADVPTLSSV